MVNTKFTTMAASGTEEVDVTREKHAWASKFLVISYFFNWEVYTWLFILLFLFKLYILSRVTYFTINF